MNLDIAVLSGDGIGPEVTKQAIKTLKAVGEVYNHTFTRKNITIVFRF